MSLPPLFDVAVNFLLYACCIAFSLPSYIHGNTPTMQPVVRCPYRVLDIIAVSIN